jgi:peptidoglycan/LPS O-acetylase OafA/YrhL
MPDHTQSHRSDIDGLRALAVLLVVLHHVAPALMPGGFVGVDVFFVISGFLITGILDRTMRDGTFRYVEFVWKRCRRIVPALIAVLCGTLVLGICILTGPELVSLSHHVTAGSLSSSNLLLLSEAGYFDSASSLKPLLHLWSLGVEEQFYLLWPLLLMLLPLRASLRILSVALIVMLSLMVSESLAYSHPSQAFYLLHSRAWELGSGGMLALGWTWLHTNAEQMVTRNTLFARCRDAASLVGVMMIVAAAITMQAGVAWPGVSAMVPVCGTLLILAAGPDSFINRTLLACTPARWLGQRSYSLYLWHWPPLAFLQILALENSASALTVQLLSALLMIPALGLAHLTYELIEQPTHRRATRLHSAERITLRHLRPYAMALGGIALVALGVAALHGLPGRYSTVGGDTMALLRDASPDSITVYEQRATKCALADKGNATWCWRIAGTGAGVAVFGDSHAEVLFAGLAARTKSTPMLLTGRKGCAPILNTETIADRLAEICRRSSLLAHDAITADSTIRTVLLVSRGPAYLSGAAYGVDSLKAFTNVAATASRADTLTLAHAYEAGILRTVRSFQALGKHVVLVLDVPELGFLPQECAIGRPFRLRVVRAPCALPRSVVDARNAHYRALAKRVQQQAPGLLLFDASQSLCDASLCYAMRNGRLLYSDANHLTMYGSRIVTETLVPLIHSRMTGTIASARAH